MSSKVVALYIRVSTEDQASGVSEDDRPGEAAFSPY